jgi:hypothetical protein
MVGQQQDNKPTVEQFNSQPRNQDKAERLRHPERKGGLCQN